MKYWAYINGEVSQKAYSETELQQLPNFGPDILVCSEVSAVSQNPDWKLVRELLPHLIRPKAPDLSKFRPTPPTSAQQQGKQNPLTAPDVLPVGVNASPAVQQSQSAPVQNINTNNANSELLAQLESLTAKISSLEHKIVEQEQELAAANNKVVEQIQNEPEIQDIGEATFVSDPQNDQEDDVLEVPFDNDFEVPFDTNKSSEEIAQEAEALLVKHEEEIEEYNADDPNAAPMPFDSSEIQGILEDTIRKENNFDNPYENQDFHKQDNGKILEESTEDKNQPKTRTFIAQDLISKTTLDLSDKKEEQTKATTENSNDNKIENQEKEESQSKEEPQGKEETALKEDKTEEIINTEEQKTDDKPVAEERKLESENLTEEQKNEEITPETVEENIQKTEDIVNESKSITEESLEQEIAPVSLNSLPLKEDNTSEEPKNEEENIPEPQLNSIDNIPEVKIEEKQEEPTYEADLVSLAELPAQQHNDDTEERQISEDQVQEIPVLDGNKEEEVVPSQEEEQITVQKSEDTLQISAPENTAENEEYPEDEDLLKTMLSKEELNEDPSDEPMDEYEMTQGFTPVDETNNTVKEHESSIDIGSESSEELKIAENSLNSEIGVVPENTTDDSIESVQEQDKSNELSMTGISISNDPTTAAVLDEIAQEKSINAAPAASTDKLFEELERTYRETEDPNNVNELVDGVNTVEVDTSEVNNLAKTEDSLNQEFAKEDEFLKTFTTSVEEVFLDQPTAIISDYVPPSDNMEHSKPAVMPENITRRKPSDIKTVPLVPEAMGQEIWSAPYVESATAKVRRKSMVGRLIIFGVAMFVVVIMLLFALAGLAWVKILPEKLSPLHAIIGHYYEQKLPQNNVVTEQDLDMAPEMIEQNVSVPARQDNQNGTSDVVQAVKNYTFADSTTLEARIIASNKVYGEQLEWSLFPTEEPNIYSVAVRLPQNDAGQGFSYRFNYNALDKTLTPTTSESKNIMENYL